MAVNPRWEHAFADVNGTRLHYVRTGTGPLLLLLHGWPQTWYAWRHCIDALAQTHTVVAPDLRGMGESQFADDGFDQRTVAADLHALIAALDFPRAVIAAHDFGALPAYQLAVDHPQTVERLAIIDVGLMGAGFEDLLRLTPELNLWWFGFHLVEGLAEALVAGRERAYLSWFYNGPLVVQRNAIGPGDVDEYVRRYAQPGAMRRSFAWYRALFADAACTAAAKEGLLTMPVLAIGGEGSFGAYVEQNLRNVASEVRGVVISSCGHFVAEEQPQALLAALIPFVRTS
ncbi:hydrolase [Vulcanimicrobium alpinum]|uniref:Hydrolase n=1 Tax=Vulcanimicrobium alpinum TaxID=3016050 RepID=A0AAN1XYD6_UNVUL|nr:alpha/beta hydrolase [Vulcanimicrobium alpinum]BDE06906.1 hydrolase [Vulcanimicrobium alpinum]